MVDLSTAPTPAPLWPSYRFSSRFPSGVVLLCLLLASRSSTGLGRSTRTSGNCSHTPISTIDSVEFSCIAASSTWALAHKVRCYRELAQSRRPRRRRHCFSSGLKALMAYTSSREETRTRRLRLLLLCCCLGTLLHIDRVFRSSSVEVSHFCFCIKAILSVPFTISLAAKKSCITILDREGAIARRLGAWAAVRHPQALLHRTCTAFESGHLPSLNVVGGGYPQSRFLGCISGGGHAFD